MFVAGFAVPHHPLPTPRYWAATTCYMGIAAFGFLNKGNVSRKERKLPWSPSGIPEKKKMFKYWLVWLNMMRPQSCTYIFVSCFCRGRGKALKQAGGEGTRWQADGDTWVTSSWPGPAGVRGRARRGRAPKLPAPGGWSKSTVQLSPELWHEPHCSNAVSPCLEAKTRCKIC